MTEAEKMELVESSAVMDWNYDEPETFDAVAYTKADDGRWIVVAECSFREHGSDAFNVLDGKLEAVKKRMPYREYRVCKRKVVTRYFFSS